MSGMLEHFIAGKLNVPINRCRWDIFGGNGTTWIYIIIIQAVREAAAICPAPCDLTFDLERSVRVTCDVIYLCANFSFLTPLCSRLRPDIRDKTSARRQTHIIA